MSADYISPTDMMPKAAGEATRHVPPNVLKFDGPRGLGPATTKPRGRGLVSQAPIPAAPLTPAPLDPMSIFMAAMIPLVLSLTQSVVPCPLAPVPAQLAPAPRNISVAIEDSEPLNLPEPGVATRFPFLPTHTLECLLAFKEEVGINIVDKIGVLDHWDLTPDIIHEVPHEHLAGILGVSEGKTIRFQMFCRQWAQVFSRKLKQKEIL